MKKLLALLFISSLFAYPNCTMCHDGGYKKKLDNYTPKEIINMMKQYKNMGGMNSMGRIASSMTDEEIKKVAYEYGKK